MIITIIVIIVIIITIIIIISITIILIIIITFIYLYLFIHSFIHSCIIIIMMLIHFHVNMISLMMIVNSRMLRQVLLFGFSEGSLGSLITAENHRHLPEVHWRFSTLGSRNSTSSGRDLEGFGLRILELRDVKGFRLSRLAQGSGVLSE